MRIVIVGETGRGATATIFGNAFRKLGAEVKNVDDNRIYRDAAPFAKYRIANRLFRDILALFVQKRMLSEITSFEPDLVLVIKGLLIHPDTLAAAKKMLPRMRLMNFNPDNPFHNKYHGITNRWIISSIQLYDVYLIWDKYLIKKLLAAGAKRAEFLPLAFDPDISRKVAASPEEKSVYGADVSFIGSWDHERDAWLGPLTDLDLSIWGNAWEKASRKLRAKWRGRATRGDEFEKICAASKIMLNFTRDQTGEGHNMRAFEIPACGGFMLSVRTEGQQEFFPEGKAAAYFSDPQELRSKIEYYLSHEEERVAMANEAYRRVIEGHHTYKDRASRILELYEELKNGA